ncbi:MAG: hypothetical protein PHI45_01685, partial [Candidatus Pacebacteria bacterium]|nr:hypothetical protein [Candidatus Paceibacterota bacterium]
FTLIEIMIVVLTISILSSIIYVASGGIRERGEFAKVLMFSEKLNSSLAENVVGQWDFNEGTGSSVYDSSLNENTGTITGATWETNQSNCISGSCLSFNGTSDYVATKSFSLIPPALTYSAWIKSFNDGSHNTQTLISDAAQSNTVGYIFCYRSTNSLIWQYARSGSTRSLFSASNFFLEYNDIFVHVVIMVDYDAKTYSVYRNGIIHSNGELTETPSFPLANRIKYFGTYSPTHTSKIVGIIDEVALYDRIISISNIKQNYFIGINNLFLKNQISKEEYSERIKLAKNE